MLSKLLAVVVFFISLNLLTKDLTYDLGVGTGTYSGYSYYEVNLGLNYYFYPHLNFRNAFFYRSPSIGSSYFGLDSSMQAWAIYDISENTSFNYHTGVGYRFQSEDNGAPFLEGGTLFRSGGFAFGVRVKHLFYSVKGTQYKDDTILGIILGASGSI